MAAGRGPRAMLGVTLVACGGALLFLGLRRQSELVAAISPLPPSGSQAARAPERRTYRDLETWADIALAMTLLIAAGTIFAARAPQRRTAIVAPRVEPRLPESTRHPKGESRIHLA